MQYTYDFKKLPKSEIELNVTIPLADLKTFLDKAVENISQSTKIEGFRPGKASYEIIRQKVGEMKIYEEAAALATEKSYIEIAVKEKLEPLGSPKVDFVKLAPDNDFVYKAVVTLIPTVELGDYKSIKVTEKEIKITDSDINKTLEELQQAKATEVLEDKAAAKGDKVEINFDVLRDNVPIESGQQKKYPLIIGLGHFIPGFEENLIGLKANEEKSFELSFPKEYHNKTLAGKPATFKVKILGVYKRTLPELTDDFAKLFGQESLAKLKQQIEHNMEHEEHDKEEEKVERELLEKFIAMSKFGEIPDSLITSETNKMLQELESNLSMQGLALDEYLKHLTKTTEQMKLEFAPQAMKRVQSSLALRALFFQEKINVEEKEIDQEIEMASKMYQNNPDILKNLQNPAYRDYLRNMLGNRKTMDLLKTTCVVRTNPKHECNHQH